MITRAARIGALGTIAVLALAFFVVRPPVPPSPIMRDFEAQYAAGRTYASGRDPYSTAIWQAEREVPGVDRRHEELLPFVGAPLWLPLLAALSRLPYLAAAAVWAVAIGTSVVTILCGSLALAGGRLDRSNLISLGTLCVGFTPLISGMALGQEALPAFAGTIGALWVGQRSRWAAAACSVLCGFKPDFAAPLVPLLFRRRWLALLGLAAGFAVAASVAADGPSGVARYFQAIRGQTAAERLDVIQFTPFSIAYDFGLNPHHAAVIAAAVALSALLFLVWVLGGQHCGSVESATLVAAGLPLYCPFVHAHDLIVALLPGLVCVHRARGATWAAGACGLLLVAGGWFGFSQGGAGLWFTVALFTVAVCAVIALADPALGVLRLLPLGLVPLVVVYGFFAVAHPVVFWPLALPHGFAVSGHSTAALVWEAEQRANGLEHPDPWWASLRVLSLAGTTMLYAATLALFWPERMVQRAPRMLRRILVEG